MNMRRKTFLAIFSCLCFFLSGCTGELRHQVARLESENQGYQAAIKDKQAQITKLEAELASLSFSNDALRTLLNKKTAEIDKLQTGDGDLKETSRQKESQVGADSTAKEIEALKKQIDRLNAERDALRNEKKPIDAQPAKLRAVRLKILTGNGKPASAKEMARMVEAMGYKVERVDKAPTANFSQNTVFYAPDARNDADHIAKRLGGNAVVKPLTWPSSFNLIVVTGKAF
jgi:hypothetical protein